MRDPLEVVTSLSDWLKQTIEKDTLLPIGLCNTHHDKKNSRMTNLPVHMWQALECVPIILSPYCCKYSHSGRHHLTVQRPPQRALPPRTAGRAPGQSGYLQPTKKAFLVRPCFFYKQPIHTHSCHVLILSCVIIDGLLYFATQADFTLNVTPFWE